MPEVAIAVRRLFVEFGSHVALADVSLDVPVGSTLAVIGPNGSGKSTLLRAIARLVETRRGHTEIGDRRVAMVLQSTDVDPGVPITVRDTVKLGRYARLGMFRPMRRADAAAVDQALERLDISDLADRQLHDLSGGQRQRVLLAQGLAEDADILLLDEPVTGLDLAARDLVHQVIGDEQMAGKTVVVTTHSIPDASRCDQVALLASRLIAAGPPEDVLTERHLQDAYGSKVVKVGGDFVVDDPHHHAH